MIPIPTSILFFCIFQIIFSGICLAAVLLTMTRMWKYFLEINKRITDREDEMIERGAISFKEQMADMIHASSRQES